MDSIEQLKTMRDAAKSRIEALPDFKLMVKLTTLIEELEEMFGSEASETTTEESSDAEAEEEVERAPAAAAGEQPRQGLHKWRSQLASSTIAAKPAPEPVVEQLEEGLAQVEIEETPVTSPVAEVADELEEELEAGLPNVEQSASPAGPAQEADQLADEYTPLDTDTALKQAMAELEADLDKASVDPKTSRFRYGNSS